MDDFRDDIKEIKTDVKAHTETLASIDKTLAVQALQLTEHMARTSAAEKRIDQVQEQIDPLKDLVKNVHFMLKIAGGAIVIIELVRTILEIKSHLLGF